MFDDDVNIYKIEVTREDIIPELTKLVYELKGKYRIREQSELLGFALGPNTYKSFEFALHDRQMIYQKTIDPDITTFMGYQIWCSPFPGIVPLFKRAGWYVAHEMAKSWMNTDQMN